MNLNVKKQIRGAFCVVFFRSLDIWWISPMCSQRHNTKRTYLASRFHTEWYCTAAVSPQMLDNFYQLNRLISKTQDATVLNSKMSLNVRLTDDVITPPGAGILHAKCISRKVHSDFWYAPMEIVGIMNLYHTAVSLLLCEPSFQFS